MKKHSRFFLYNLFALCALVLIAGQVKALTIDPATATALYTGSQNEEPVILAYLNTQITNFSSLFLYKSEPKEYPKGSNNYTVVEEGLLGNSYETTFDPISDPLNATITYTGGDIVGPTAYLLVKDGNQVPAWYLYNLSNLTIGSSTYIWDGTETIYLQNFWPNQGAISHVSLYGNRAPVPEPATMLLFGTGLAGLAAVARRRKN